MRLSGLLSVFVVLAATGAVGGVSGRIVQVGYPLGALEDEALEDTAGRPKFRDGAWVPILVELHSEESGPLFEGRLRVTQRDRDGDLVTTEEPVSLRGTRRFWVYTIAGAERADDSFSVRLVNAAGQTVRVRDSVTGSEADRLLPSASPVALGAEDVVVLDISERAVPALRFLEAENAGGERITDRPVVLGRHAARDVPTHWCGLDMVDVVVWDSPDPGGLTDRLRQMSALVEWVHRGGVLVLGVGATWQQIQKSDLEPLLPAPVGPAERVTELPELVEMFPGQALPARLPRPIEVCPLERALLRPGSLVWRPPSGVEPAGRILACRRAVGRGQVVYFGASLRELLGLVKDPSQLVMWAVQVRQGRQGERGPVTWVRKELFDDLAREVGFAPRTGAYFLFGVVFLVTYVLVSTVGTWHWLKGRGWTHHSWTAFAAVAVLASLLSLASVRLVRGVGYDVQELNVVDLRAGEYGAVVTAYYGMKTSSHERLDLMVPQDWTRIDEAVESSCVLRPLPHSPTAQSLFVAREEYRVVPGRGRLMDVPFRATLKQLEGSWRGEIGGRIEASLTGKWDADRFFPDQASWIRNGLGVDLQGCVLIQAVRDPLPTDTSRSSLGIWCHALGDGRLANGATLSSLEKVIRRSGEAPVLVHFQSQWARKAGARAGEPSGGSDDQARAARLDIEGVQAELLLVSTFREYDGVLSSGMRGALGSSTELARTYLRKLDVSELLTRDVMLLVGFSDAPGPARLCYRPAGTDRRFRPTRPSRCLTMYRVLIPIKTPRPWRDRAQASGAGG